MIKNNEWRIWSSLNCRFIVLALICCHALHGFSGDLVTAEFPPPRKLCLFVYRIQQIHQDQLATLLLIFNGFSFPPELIWLKFFLHSGTSRKFLVQLPNDGVYLPRSVFSSQACELGSIFQYMTARHDWELGSGPIKHVSLRSKKPPKKLKESVGSLALLSSRKWTVTCFLSKNNKAVNKRR